MKGCFPKLQHLFMGVALVALAGCGANNAGTIASVDNASGAVQANLVWGGQNAKSAAHAMVATVPAEVASVQLTVSGTGANGPIPVVKNTVAVSGGSATGSVSGIYPGTVAVSVKALDTTGKTVYEGFALNAVVSAGATTDVGTITMNPPVVKTAEVPCLGCHETALDHTGQNIIANYKQSGHYSNTSFVDANGVGTGCVGCHGPSHNNPDPSANVGARCFECHNIAGSNATLVANHGTYYVANGTECSACHEVHNTKAANDERKDWAQSGHGATSFAAMDHNTGSCARCHNSRGLIQAMANPTAPTTMAGTAQQMITCDACHTNATTGKLRVLAGTSGNAFAVYTTSTVGYQFAPNNNLNPNKKKYYPDVAGSNLCTVCHSGTREGSATAKAQSDAYFVGYSTMKTVAPHNMPAAAVMYVKFGFTNLSTGTAGVPTASYVASLTSDLDGGSVSSTHRKLGTSAIHGDSHNKAKFVPGFLDYNGPCATCHLGGSHSLKIDAKAIAAVCVNCHSSENTIDITSIGQFEQFFLEPQKEVFNNAILLGATILNKKVADNGVTGINFYINPNTGKFSVGNTVPSTTTTGAYSSFAGDLRSIAVSLGYSAGVNHNNSSVNLGQQKFIGALSNLILMSEDQGAFAHARTYSRRLIYDSLDFLDDGVLNMSVGTTATTLSAAATLNGVANPVYGLYKKGTNAYNMSGTSLTTPYSNTSESMLYLIGWSRSTGAWNTPQRP